MSDIPWGVPSRHSDYPNEVIVPACEIAVLILEDVTRAVPLRGQLIRRCSSFLLRSFESPLRRLAPSFLI